MQFQDCRRIDLPKVKDVRGNLTHTHRGDRIPFEIARVGCPGDSQPSHSPVAVTTTMASALSVPCVDHIASTTN
jgi:hypothetical protein